MSSSTAMFRIQMGRFFYWTSRYLTFLKNARWTNKKISCFSCDAIPLNVIHVYTSGIDVAPTFHSHPLKRSVFACIEYIARIFYQRCPTFRTNCALRNWSGEKKLGIHAMDVDTSSNLIPIVQTFHPKRKHAAAKMRIYRNVLHTYRKQCSQPILFSKEQTIQKL